MTQTSSSQSISVGIDVSKDKLDVAFDPAGESLVFSNDSDGHADIVERLKPCSPERIIVEATGGYERLVVAALKAAGLPVVVMNPRQVREFARATGQLAKTDAIDASILARFGQTLRPEIRPIPDENARIMQEELGRRRQLIAMRTAEKNRLGQSHNTPVRQGIQSHLDFLDKQIEEIDKDLDKTISDSPACQEKAELLKSVPGIGDQTTRALLVHLPELGACSRQEIAALVGVAPINRDSGKMRGRRTISGGRACVRTALYMATISACRSNPLIRTYYQHLLNAGKAKKVAIIACMRKLLTIINAIIREKKPWNILPINP